MSGLRDFLCGYYFIELRGEDGLGIQTSEPDERGMPTPLTTGRQMEFADQHRSGHLGNRPNTISTKLDVLPTFSPICFRCEGFS